LQINWDLKKIIFLVEPFWLLISICVEAFNSDETGNTQFIEHFNPKIGDDRLCGQVARVPAYTSRGPGSIPGATRFSEK
jgi:hypothetical protein